MKLIQSTARGLALAAMVAVAVDGGPVGGDDVHESSLPAVAIYVRTPKADLAIINLPSRQDGLRSEEGGTNDEGTQGKILPTIGEYIRELRASGLTVLGRVDVLGWDGSAAATGILLPLEVDAKHECATTADPGLYVSVWAPEVDQVIGSLGRDIADLLPELDGIVVQARYSSARWLGYSDAARLASIDAIGTDPMDIDLTMSGSSSRSDLSRWSAWRRLSVKRALGQFAGAHSARQPEDVVWAMGDPGYYRQDELQRSKSCEDWATWLVDGIVDGVFLEGPWIASATEDGQTPPRLYAAALGLLSRMDPLPMFVPTIPTEFAGEGVDIAAQLAQLRSEGPVPALGIVVRKPEQLEAALEALRNFEPDEI